MALKVIITAVFLLLSLSFVVTANNNVFDVTQYGDKNDISKGLASAWKEACSSTIPSKVLIPEGTFILGQLKMEGPCKAAIEIEVRGIVKAPVEIEGDDWINFKYVDQFILSGGGAFDGQGKIAWKKNNCDKDKNCKSLPVNLRFGFITNGVVQNITSMDSKNFHVNLLACKNLTVQDFAIVAPHESVNTDGIHISQSNGIKILDSKIGTGDDCISLIHGCQNITVERVTCGPGHGISIGSLGGSKKEKPVAGIFVRNCTIFNTDNGVRIKSWPAKFEGLVSNVHFEDIIMKNVSNPIVIDQEYCPYNQCNKKFPSKVRIENINFKNIRGTSKTPVAVQLTCSSGIPCKEVELNDIDLTYRGEEGPAKIECSNVKPKFSGRINPGRC